MGRSPCCSKEAGLNRGSWTALEDKILTDYIKIHGEGRWRNLPQKAGLKRCGKSCRLRWLNYLRPDIKRGNISPDEEELIIRLHKLLGNRWSLIAGRLPGRTDNEIKNYWNTNLGKKVHLHRQSINTCSTAKIAKDIVPCGPSKAENPSLSPGLATPPSPGRVIRTRAVKCTKVLLNDGGRGDVSDKDAAPRGAPSTAFSEGNFDNSSGADPGLGPDIGAGGCDIGNVVIPPCAGSDANFDVDELFLADLPMNSEFIRRDEYFRDFSYVTMSNNAIASKDFHGDNHDHYDHDFLFSEELTLPDWTSSGNNNVGVLKEQCVGPINYCSSFSSFLGSEGDWLAAD